MKKFLSKENQNLISLKIQSFKDKDKFQKSSEWKIKKNRKKKSKKFM